VSLVCVQATWSMVIVAAGLAFLVGYRLRDAFDVIAAARPRPSGLLDMSTREARAALRKRHGDVGRPW